VKSVLRTNEQVGDMGLHDANLRKLGRQFAEVQNQKRFQVRSFVERKGVLLGRRVFGVQFGSSVQVVNPTASESHVNGDHGIPLPEDHFSICKPASRSSQIHGSLVDFLKGVRETSREQPRDERVEGKVDNFHDEFRAFAAEFRARGGAQKAEAAGLRPKLIEQLIIQMARRLKPEVTLDFEQAIKEVNRAVDVAVQIIKEGQRFDEDQCANSEDPLSAELSTGNTQIVVDEVLARVGRKTRSGELETASQLVDDAIVQNEQAMSEQEKTLTERHQTLIEAGIRQDSLRFDVEAVVAKVLKLGALLDSPNPALSAAVNGQFDSFYERGQNQGATFDLLVAINLARRMVESAVEGNQRSAYQNNLGNVLAHLGERESGTIRLEEAISTFRAALQERTRERVPLYWATTQANLGNALWALGSRESGTATLEEAVSAYTAALQEQTREQVPLVWARTQNNLGNALWTLGERKSGTALLEESVSAYRAALQERTRERVPFGWARTQNNLGAALRTLGERERMPIRLEQAASAFRAALQEWTRERVPLDWATTQNNLGNVLLTLGERESGTGQLEEAVLAYKAALQERTREQVPLDWAATQNNLGVALQALGERESSTTQLEQAVSAYRAALQERIRERVSLDWAATQNNLGTALQALGERESGTERLKEAVSTYKTALQERTRERVPWAWAITHTNLGNALRFLGEREGKRAQLEEALTTFQAALEVFEPAEATHYVSRVKKNIEHTETLLKQLQSRVTTS
jgi:tetratricopeptide (TPR) repeat protein